MVFLTANIPSCSLKGSIYLPSTFHPLTNIVGADLEYTIPLILNKTIAHDPDAVLFLIAKTYCDMKAESQYDHLLGNVSLRTFPWQLGIDRCWTTGW
jgi:hypothetical protein